MLTARFLRLLSLVTVSACAVDLPVDNSDSDAGIDDEKSITITAEPSTHMRWERVSTSCGNSVSVVANGGWKDASLAVTIGEYGVPVQRCTVNATVVVPVGRTLVGLDQNVQGAVSGSPASGTLRYTSRVGGALSIPAQTLAVRGSFGKRWQTNIGSTWRQRLCASRTDTRIPVRVEVSVERGSTRTLAQLNSLDVTFPDTVPCS